MTRTEAPAPEPDPIQRWAVQLRKGSLELAILASLWPRRLYGLEIVRKLADGGSLMLPEGTVYPLLARLKEEGWVESEWVTSEGGHPRKYYRLTPGGRRHLRQLAASWASFAAGLDRLLRPLRKEEER